MPKYDRERESVDIQIYVTGNHKMGTVRFKPAPDEEPRRTTEAQIRRHGINVSVNMLI